LLVSAVTIASVLDSEILRNGPAALNISLHSISAPHRSIAPKTLYGRVEVPGER